MLYFFSTFCENDEDGLPMINPQTNLLFHKTRLIHASTKRLF